MINPSLNPESGQLIAMQVCARGSVAQARACGPSQVSMCQKSRFLKYSRVPVHI